MKRMRQVFTEFFLQKIRVLSVQSVQCAFSEMWSTDETDSTGSHGLWLIVTFCHYSHRFCLFYCSNTYFFK